MWVCIVLHTALYIYLCQFAQYFFPLAFKWGRNRFFEKRSSTDRQVLMSHLSFTSVVRFAIETIRFPSAHKPCSCQEVDLWWTHLWLPACSSLSISCKAVETAKPRQLVLYKLFPTSCLDDWNETRSFQWFWVRILAAPASKYFWNLALCVRPFDLALMSPWRGTTKSIDQVTAIVFHPFFHLVDVYCAVHINFTSWSTGTEINWALKRK